SSSYHHKHHSFPTRRSSDLADVLNTEVIRPREIETTALGAAFAAGLGHGFWKDLQSLEELVATDKCWIPNMDAEERDRLYSEWRSEEHTSELQSRFDLVCRL